MPPEAALDAAARAAAATAPPPMPPEAALDDAARAARRHPRRMRPSPLLDGNGYAEHAPNVVFPKEGSPMRITQTFTTLLLLLLALLPSSSTMAHPGRDCGRLGLKSRPG